ncbi:hypothetical protein SteCoe_8791 [Stentor coeruleus]|uniref:Uncharacterized protein n=1 Tax=Stentor coeruleus TaxID=5963 RepID=A0A1R2CJ65_9CILI|nr:hypothetical protein SteCoe_8791 [Stentor coeruleus]
MEAEPTERKNPNLYKYKIRVISEEETDIVSIVPEMLKKIGTNTSVVEPDNIEHFTDEEQTVSIEVQGQAIINALEILKNRTDNLQLQLNDQTKALTKLYCPELAVGKIERLLFQMEDIKTRKIFSNCLICTESCSII